MRDFLSGDAVVFFVHWTHAIGRPAHCLARLVPAHGAERPVVVLTELADNPDARGVSSDVVGAAAAVLATEAAAGLDPQAVRWFTQHGPYSSYEATGAETFTEVVMPFAGGRYHDDLTGHRLLGPAEAAELAARLRLAPVLDVLAQLGHTR
ncbi:hypothetical protein [Streptomyces ehimensis]|uniref:Uncharacterized protein n=1 Tax=Streptomyces ehimensis TaxID=68195 RepID=A0ABV9BV85_9ACTN